MLCRGEMNHYCTFVGYASGEIHILQYADFNGDARRAQLLQPVDFDVCLRATRGDYIHSETMRVQRQTRTNESSRPGDEQANDLGVIGCHARLCTE